jgi:hypothetical protein
MNNQQIVNIIRESAILLKQEYDDAILDQTDLLATNYGIDEWEAFKHDLVEAGNKVRIIYMENSLRLDDFPDLIRELYMPVVAFDTTSDSIVPAIIFADKKGNTKLLRIGDEENELTDFTPECCQTFLKNENGEVVFMGVFSYNPGYIRYRWLTGDADHHRGIYSKADIQQGCSGICLQGAAH